MKMKYVLLAVFILALGFEIYRIEKQLSAVTLELTKTSRAPVKITELTEATTFDTTDVFLVSDAGTTSRKLTGRKITGAIHDTATTLRSEMGTAGSGIPGTVGNKQIAIGLTGDSLTSDADFKIDTDSLVTKHVAIHGDIYWKKLTGLSGNYAKVWNGSTQKEDTASLTPASQAWRDYKKMNIFQRIWLVRFWDARKHEAYPLPNRAGVELRRWDPAEGMYQFEYEMEMMGLGLYQLYKVAGGMFLLIVGGLLYVILRKK